MPNGHKTFQTDHKNANIIHSKAQNIPKLRLVSNRLATLQHGYCDEGTKNH
jgi:hypothetical protein